MGWTDERVETLRKLWHDGLSASQIARQLGGVSRNAVIGKVHREGLAGRAPRSTRARSASENALPSRLARSTPTAPRVIAAAAADAEPRPPHRLHRGPLDETPHTHECKWPIGDPTDHHFRFCRAERKQGAFCLEHARLAYSAPATRQSAAVTYRSLRRYL